jgi:hypothetical protein
MTWQEFVDKVDTVLDAMSLGREQVDIRYIDVLGSDGVKGVEVLRKDEGRYEMFVE